MAAEIFDTGPISKGSKHLIIVEDSINDVLTVCLNYGAKLYRGVLLDSNSRNVPYGVNIVKTDSDQVFSTKRDIIVQHEKNTLMKGTSQQGQFSALSYRNTYYQDVENKPANFVSSAVHSLLRPLRDKNIRKMRLRPRQVLCSKCKAACSESSTAQPDLKATVTAANKMNPTNSNPIRISSNMLPKISLPRVNSRDGQRKRKAVTLLDEQSEYNRKLRKLMGRKPLVKPNSSKSNSVIKILYANPEGQRSSTVVEIPTETTCIKLSEKPVVVPVVAHDDTSIDKIENKKARKALKKAKREKRRLEKNNSEMAEKHSSKHKHKKHRHRDNEHSIPNSDFSPASLNASYNSSSSSNSFNTDTDKYVSSPNASSLPIGPPVHESNVSSIAIRPSVHQNVSSVPIGDFPGKWIPIGSSFVSNNNDDSETNSIMHNVNEQKTTEDSLDDKLYMNGVQYPASPSSSAHSNTNKNYDVYDFNDDSDNNDDDITDDKTEPLTMRINTYTIQECENSKGSLLRVGDVVWGKIQGFPWWPGTIISITVTQRENDMLLVRVAHLTWFASSTMSHIDCMDLYPFLEDFKHRYKKQKRGPYRMAIKLATHAVEALAMEGSAANDANTEDDFVDN